MLQFCGVCYMCLSIWGIIQLVIMGVLYRMESLGLIEDTEEHHFSDLDDFIKRTQENYRTVSTNCFIAAAIYVVILGCSLLCLWKAKKAEKMKEAKLLDDKLSCTFEVVELTEKQKKKIK
ncbi:ribonuclease kappa-like [Leguminivora glycinivorella]|uniref:ribonuclease kappa-like n=1 Tax=Leguminivora glycinivorella TaxID=1035111 RepID=UPI00200FBD7C|nr:ribonuclease kappa-like [Leguminivora glycinivorella]